MAEQINWLRAYLSLSCFLIAAICRLAITVIKPRKCSRSAGKTQ